MLTRWTTKILHPTLDTNIPTIMNIGHRFVSLSEEKKMPASLVDTEEGNEEAEIDDDGALPPKKKGRPGKSSLASLGKSTGSTASPLQGNRGN